MGRGGCRWDTVWGDSDNLGKWNIDNKRERVCVCVCVESEYQVVITFNTS